jgi:hypothetical protein
MAEYAPRYAPGADITSQASATTTAGQLVSVSGDGTVAPSGANDTAWVGVAAFDAASGAKVTIRTGGVQRLVNTGGVTAGDMVVASATAGTVATLAAVTTPTAADVTNSRAIVGVCLTTATTTNLVDVLMER